MAETTIEWTTSPPLPRDVVLPRRMKIPGFGKALPKGHILPAGSRVGGFTFNGWLGCSKVSPGCRHCYAEKDMAVTMRQGGRVKWGKDAERVRTSASTWNKPHTWNRVAETLGVPLFVFAQSLSDTFEDRADLEDWRHDLMDLIRATPNLRWLLLTKRPDVMARYAAEHGWPSNAWAGTTVEDQRRADERIPYLLRVPAPVRFLSCEPLLGPVDLGPWMGTYDCRSGPGCWRGWPWQREQGSDDSSGDGPACPWCGSVYHVGPVEGSEEPDDRNPRLWGIHWVIVGGESGGKARPMHPDWARSLRDQCVEAGVPFLFKQNGAWVEAEQGPGDPVVAYLDGHADEPFGWGMLDRQRPHTWMYRVGKKAAGRLLDGRTWDEIPEVAP